MMSRKNLIRFNPTNSIRISFLKSVVIGILVFFLVGCPSQAPKVDFDENRGSAYYLVQAENSSGSARIDWQLLAIRALVLENQLTKASSLLSNLPTNLTTEQQKEMILSQAEISSALNRSFDLSVLPVTSLNTSQKIRYYRANIALSGQVNDVNSQIRSYIELELLGTDFQRHQIINETWRFLTSLEESDIARILVYASESTLQGWVDLIYTYHSNTGVYVIEEEDDEETIQQKETLAFQLLKNAVSEWQMQYAMHPAAIYLPRNIYGEKYRLPDETGQKTVALFLPLSGSSQIFGSTIRQGYLDASKFYPNESSQNVYLFDTAAYPLADLLRQAEQKGAQIIIGPLLKENVIAISRLSSSLPILALNKTTQEENQYVKAGNKICFFALAPEDEAIDAARHIYRQRKTKPLLLVPRTGLGERVAKSFAEQWLQLSGERDVYVQYFDDIHTLRTQMNKGVGIELEGQPILSQHIANSDQDGLGYLLSGIIDNTQETIDKPFDALYIYASYEELNVLNPMLGMKSNREQTDDEGNVTVIEKNIPPIYASSRSNSAEVTEDFRYEMERMQFSEIPLIVNRSDLLSELPTYIQGDYTLVRLYAMGIDAWRLANRMTELTSYQSDVLDGVTGKLSVTENCEITRELPWQRFRNGKTVLVP